MTTVGGDIDLGMYVEKEETAPGGGRMRWRVAIEPPNLGLGGVTSMLSIDEEMFGGGTKVYEQGGILLDVDAAKWLRDRLDEAIPRMEALELAAAQPRCKRDGCRDLAKPEARYCEQHMRTDP